MRIIHFFFFVFFFLNINIDAQTILKNGYFEEYTSAPNDISQINLARHWKAVSVTADLFCEPGFFNVEAYEGDCYAGFGLWSSTAPYITTESFSQLLDTPLKADTDYYIQFHAAYAFWSAGICSSIELFGMLSNPFPLNNEDNYVGSQLDAELLGSTDVITNVEWEKFSFCFRPTENHRHLIFSVSDNSCDQYFYIDAIEIYELEQEKFFEDTLSLCYGDTILLGTEIDNANFQWNDGSTNATLAVTEPGDYWWLVDTVCGLVLSDSTTVLDHRIYLEEGFLGEDTIICQDEPPLIAVNTTQEELNYFWSNGEMEAMITATNEGNYSLTVEKGDCFIIDDIQIDFISCEPCTFYLPNAFSPNFDGINDEFRAYSNCNILTYSLQIFDRWGTLVFESRNIVDGWDGRGRDGKIMTDQVLAYVLQYEAEEFGERIQGIESGDVALIK